MIAWRSRTRSLPSSAIEKKRSSSVDHLESVTSTAKAAVGRPGRALVDVVGSRTGRLPISAARAPENSTVGDPDQEVLDLIRVRIVRRRAARSTPGECEALGGRHRSFDDAGRTGPTAAGQAAVLVGLAGPDLCFHRRSHGGRDQNKRREKNCNRPHESLARRFKNAPLSLRLEV